MKTKDIAKNHELDHSRFDKWLASSGQAVKTGFFGYDIDESQDINEIVRKFNIHLAEEQENEKGPAPKMSASQSKPSVLNRKSKQALRSMLITSGFNFDGYMITKYSGYISGDDAVQVDRPKQGWLGMNGNAGEDLLSAMVQIRRKALSELKEAAYALGCNAVIGVRL